MRSFYLEMIDKYEDFYTKGNLDLDEYGNYKVQSLIQICKDQMEKMKSKYKDPRISSYLQQCIDQTEDQLLQSILDLKKVYKSDIDGRKQRFQIIKNQLNKEIEDLERSSSYEIDIIEREILFYKKKLDEYEK